MTPGGISGERERTEALRESEERYRLMVEGSEQVFFYVHDLKHRIEYLSPSVKNVLGYLLSTTSDARTRLC